jgi:hypothetical protein
MLAFLVALPAGCAVRGDVELLESELRRQEEMQQEIAAELKTARDELRVARTDADTLRAQLSKRGQLALVSEQAEVLYKAEAIKFNMMLTSGANRDGEPGDDGISVLLQPVDSQGDLVKLVGEIDLELFDLNREGESQRIGQWHFTIDEVREHWHRGFLSAGYLFQLDWQTAPTSPELTLHARFIPPDGRKFDATAQVRVDPGSAATASVAEVPPPVETKAKRVIPASHSEPAAPPRQPRKLRLRSAPKKGPEAKEAKPAPLETSDNFTELTIPTLR